MKEIFAEIGNEPWRTLINLIGAAVIAYITVRLALARYKQERVWDRQMTTLGDLIDALTEMSRVDFMRWEAANEISPEHGSDVEGKDDEEEVVLIESPALEDRYAAARRRFESAAAMAKLVLDDEINRVIDEWMDTMDLNREEYLKDPDYSLTLLYAKDVTASDECIATLVKLGRGVAKLNR